MGTGALATYSGSSQLLTQVAWLESTAGRFEAADHAIAKAFSIDAYDEQAHATRVDTLYTRRDVAAALRCVNESLMHFPSSASLNALPLSAKLV